MTTLPGAGVLIGVPALLGKSAPLWALRRSPLKMLRVPNAEFAFSGTGGTNANSGTGFGPAPPSQADAISAFSRSMRAASVAGGSTKSGSTVSRRVANRLVLTARRCLAVVAPAGPVADTDTV